MTPLTAELFARAVIASAATFGDHPIEALTSTDRRKRRAVIPAAYGLKRATGAEIAPICRVLGISANAAKVTQSRGSDAFLRARDAAEGAVRCHLKAQGVGAAPKLVAATPAPAAPPPARPAAPKPPPSPSARYERRAPRGATVQNLGDGVQVIRLKPVTPSIARHAKQQIDRGADPEEVAELFEVALESLQRAIAQLEAA